MSPEFFQSLLTLNYTVTDDFWTVSELSAMRQVYADFQTTGHFRPAKIGHSTAATLDSSQRTDTICWLERENPQTRFIFQKLENLRLFFNQEIQLGAFRAETHFAYYPSGAKYNRHLDVHPSQRQAPGGRLLSMISYLHPEWKKGMGGELMLYPADASRLSIEPQPGRTIFFFSETMEHEVLESHFDRHSLACWFHRR